MTVRIITGDCRESLRAMPDDSVHCCVTSPPYFGLRDYGVPGQIGLEPTPDAFVAELVAVFAEVRRVLRPDGTCWVNLGDSYAGSWGAQGHRVSVSDDVSWHGSQILNHPKRGSRTIRQSGLKPKDLIGIPWRVAFALQADGWWLRQDIIWAKPNAMPESVHDRCTKSHEYLFLLTKSKRYWFDQLSIREPHSENSLARVGRGRSDCHKWADGGPGDQTLAKDISRACHPNGRNKRSVWTVPTHPFAEAHFATFPPSLIDPCILAGCPKGGTVLDPFGGVGTTGLVADRLGRDAVLIELNPDYAAIAERRIKGDAPLLASVSA